MYYVDIKDMNIKFILNQADKCEAHSSILLLIVIHSTFSGGDKRSMIRETWGAEKYTDEFVPILFFLPVYPDGPREIQMSIQRESEVHRDIIQGSFKSGDSFTEKLLTSSIWINRYCSHAYHVLMVEDYTVVDIFKVITYLKSLSFSWNPVFLCDYLSPHEETLLEKKEVKKPYCGTYAFLTTPSVLGQLANALYNNQDALRNAWLSEIADMASVIWTNTSQYFTGTRRKPSMLKELMSENYLNSHVMIAFVRDTIEGREAIMMRHGWKLIQEQQSPNNAFRLYDEQFQSSEASDSNNILVFALGLMFVDCLIVGLIFVLIFCKRKRRKV